MTRWTQVTAQLDRAPDDWSALAEVFARHGVPGTLQTDDPPALSGYFAEAHDLDLPSLTKELKALGAVAVITQEVADENWAESWKQFFKPRRVGRRFVVRPTWEEFSAGAEDLEIVLDPGQAFGTGDHPTTRLCLELLELAEVEGKRLADIGCGTGILAIGALKLGAREVHGVDIDEVAIESSRDNAARNGTPFPAIVGKGFGPIAEHGPFDVVISNIISAALIALAPDAYDQIVPDGRWIVSGIIAGNWTDVRRAAEREGFRLEAERQEGEWVAATFRR